jgi:hypothetical protein
MTQHVTCAFLELFIGVHVTQYAVMLPLNLQVSSSEAAAAFEKYHGENFFLTRPSEGAALQPSNPIRIQPKDNFQQHASGLQCQASLALHAPTSANICKRRPAQGEGELPAVLGHIGGCGGAAQGRAAGL